MDNMKIKIGLELTELISQTTKAIEVLKKELNPYSKRRFGSNIQPDINYHLTICGHPNGGVFSACLNRYVGNTELLEAIVNVLEGQLERFQQQFDEL